MSSKSSLTNCLRQRRQARGWSQQELADRAGLPRANVSAIEIGRLVPSAAAALALAAALDCRVEDLFQLTRTVAEQAEWAWINAQPTARYWQAEVGGRRRLYPVETTCLGTQAHDGRADGQSLTARIDAPPPTLVMACCDPAVGLLAAELTRCHGVRLLAFPRSSRQALDLLRQGLVHIAGLHLDHAGGAGNAAAARTMLGPGYTLLHVAHWDEGVVTDSARGRSSLQSLVRGRLRWVGREPGSGARQCLDEILGNRRRLPLVARDHRGVVEAVRAGWADAGVCLRVVGEEAGLSFHSVRREAYDLCFSTRLSDDPRIKALLSVLRSNDYRRQFDDLPGYEALSAEEEILQAVP
jgi:molybdate-binding protein/transcriptional regulator with XRE-family HTH domain